MKRVVDVLHVRQRDDRRGENETKEFQATFVSHIYFYFSIKFSSIDFMLIRVRTIVLVQL